MFRIMKLSAAVSIAILIGAPAVWAQAVTAPDAAAQDPATQDPATQDAAAQDQTAPTYGWGVFRENVPDAPVGDRNCWIQTMVDGSSINGELLAERMTQRKAEAALQRQARRGMCANQRTSTNWSARQEREADPNWSNTEGSDPAWSNANRTNADGSNRAWSNRTRTGAHRNRFTTEGSVPDGAATDGSTTDATNPGP
jgi:hypothetical protein